ncbi:MAG: hypothetical protein IJA19_06865, partial [Clostridia bacterium]|nr:hypothetical protein [Clostridia bacterium]
RNDPLNIADFFKPNEIDYAVKRMPIYIHIDTSLSGDKTGISAVAVCGKKQTKLYMGAEEVVSEEIMYTHVFTVYIQAPQGSEISLEKNRQFVYYLSKIGFNIYGVSLDGFQSADTRQIFEAKGYNATIKSLDKTPDGYLVTRSAMNDGRIGLIRIEPLETELVQLQRDNVTGKLDHPMDGSKDGSDSLAGAIWNASTHQDDYIMDLDLMTSVANVNDDTDAETNFKQAFSTALSSDYTKRAQDQMDRLMSDLSSDDGVFVW